MTEPPSTPTPERAELLDLYKLAVEEYQHEISFNWSRTQYWLAFNVGILAAGTALLTIPDHSGFSIIMFVAGIAAGLLSMRAVQVSHGYYRATRDRVKRFEAALNLPVEFRMDTTLGFKGKPRPKFNVNVTMVIYLLLSIVTLADLAGALLSVIAR